MPSDAEYSELANKRWDRWSPKQYLSHYFGKLGPDSLYTIRFLEREFNKEKGIIEKVLDFGCGPTAIIGLIAAPYTREIHLADYLVSNLLELKKWIDDLPDAFNWDSCISEILRIEGMPNSPSMISSRANELRRKAKIFQCDASQILPIGNRDVNYPMVLSIFCADSATSSKEEWQTYMKNILSVVAPSGKIILAALRNCKEYKIDEHSFPSANVNENDLEQMLSSEGYNNIDMEVMNVPECRDQGFESIIFCSAKKPD